MSKEPLFWNSEFEVPQTINAGSLLLAEPTMDDDYFREAVVLICRHDHDGTHGLLLNKQLDYRVQELVENFPVGFDGKVLLGGPVGNDLMQCVHNRGTLVPESLEISAGVFWGGNFEQLKKQIRAGQIRENDVRFFVGYCGWEVGQLVEEIKENSWLILNGANNAIFHTPTENLWKTLLRKQGGIYAKMADNPEDFD
ncbi:MAG TPA: YqgE/AlgH family protein [Chitinophagales bacterium]